MKQSLGSNGGTGPDPGAEHSRPSDRGINDLVRDYAMARKFSSSPATATLGARFRYLMETAPVAAFVKDAGGRFLHVNPHMRATIGKQLGPDWVGRTAAEIWPPELAARMRADDEIVMREGVFKAFMQVVPLEDGPHSFLVMKFPLATDDGLVNLGGVAVDVTHKSEADSERDRITSAIEQVTESVVITDLAGRITYVNPAFERITGYDREEVLGRTPRILKSGIHPPTFYEAMWASLSRGTPWVTNDLINRRKDGSFFTADAVMSPMRDESGNVAGYVAVERDVTIERALAERTDQVARERAMIAATIRGLRASDTVEEAAQAICHQVANLTGIAAAQFLVFEQEGAVPIGQVVKGRPDPPLQRLSRQLSRGLGSRAAEGPWVEPWLNRQGHQHDQLVGGVGPCSLAYAPVRYDERLIGLLVIQSIDAVDKTSTTEALPALVEFADLAGALIGRNLAERADTGRVRDHISAIIKRRAFHPVFQPIVDLETGAVVGYEALTRFTDGSNPETAFAEAASVGLGLDLERVTLHAALAASEALPSSAWLNLNASPELIMAGKVMASQPHEAGRRLVLEITEHSVIADYPVFLEAVAALGFPVDLAVDDAGAGFASLRHILELRPALVKLDRSLVAGLETDKVRQAMIVGLRHFARATGCRLVAEGIETEAELAALRDLDIHLGQGYLLGRPLPLEEVLKTDA
jgi:PAS domain S-box-containing protein